MRSITNQTLGALLCFFAVATAATARRTEIRMADYGIVPGTGQDLTPALNRALAAIKAAEGGGRNVTLSFEPGQYHFHGAQAARKTYYVSNHDQNQPKPTVFALEGWDGLTVEGNGAEFLFHGRLIPFALNGTTDCTLRHFSIDFVQPQIAQAEVVESSAADGTTLRMAPWVNYRVTEDGGLETYGEDWANRLVSAIAFERDTRHIVYNTGDLGLNTAGVEDLGDRRVRLPRWHDGRLAPGTVLALRSWQRPAPGIFLNECRDTRIEDVKVHYADGMGLLAQRCTDITLESFGVCLRGSDDPRYFTTQADATHFSQCRGHIRSNGGLYEHMMDDAINIHGVYLRVKERRDDYTILASYEHGQAWGFAWGDPGDEVQFIRSRTMETAGAVNRIAAIEPAGQAGVTGAKAFVIRMEQPLDSAIAGGEAFGIENLTWTPTVEFRHNVVRNNRARGALFSSPRRTVVEDNLFDHTSGTAILLCGDCNGWYESGACRDLLIRRNTFINALTSMYQFTNAVISIYPEIPDLEQQKAYFHGGKRGAIRIEDNTFEAFDAPLLYAKSVDGLVFKDNVLRTNSDYRPFHWNKQRVTLERVARAEIDETYKKR